MLFSSVEYAIFLASVILLVEAFRRRDAQLWILTLASYYFYFIDSGSLFILLLLISYINFFCGERIHKAGGGAKKAYLFLGVGSSLLTLGYFKYANFVLDSVNWLTNALGVDYSQAHLDILLPVGISFFTFQALSYTFDIYRGTLTPVKSFRDFAFFISFFPQLVAGPIVRAADFLPQLGRDIAISPDNLKLGMTRIGYGIVKKVVFADNLAVFVANVFDDPTTFGPSHIFLATVAFGIQIYCDFSGYTDIALGSAKIFGFDLRRNFDKPYFSGSLTDFWRRWNISLSSWLRDYLYIPLGGNRKGRVRTYINILVTMSLGGLWHGASWNFVLWGVYHGGLLILEKVIGGYMVVGGGIARLSNLRAVRVFRVMATQYLVLLGWILFRAHEPRYFIHCIRQYLEFTLTLPASQLTSVAWENPLTASLIIAFLALHVFSLYRGDTVIWLGSLKLRFWIAYCTLVFFLLLVLTPSEIPMFIYSQF